MRGRWSSGLLAYPVVGRAAVQAEIDMQMVGVRRVAAGAEHGEEIAAGGGAERGEEGRLGGRRPRGRPQGEAAAVALNEGGDVEGIASGVLAKLARGFVVAVAAD